MQSLHDAAMRGRGFVWLALGALAAAGCAERSSEPADAEPAAPAPQAASSAVAFEGARVIVGDGTVIEQAVLVVDGGRIEAVGRAGEVSVPAGAARVDLAGMTVMPAIVDTHTHLSRERDALIEDLRSRARFGVGAALSLGQDDGDELYRVRDETIPGAARYRLAGRGITSPEPGRSEIPYWITTPEEGRAAVRELAERRVDIVKIWVDDRNGQYQKLGPELYGAVIDEAHAHGLRVTAHIFALEDAKGLLRAGVDAFAHGVRDRDVDDELVALLEERPDFVLVPNLPDRGVPTDLSWLEGKVPAERLAELQAAASTERPEAQAAFAIQARNLARLAREGVTIALGTDGNTPWGPHLEMADMVAAGLTPEQVIVAATRNGAELVGIDDMGTLEPGKSADFIVLEANPLEDITNTRRIAAVYLRGERVGDAQGSVAAVR
ncbi:MAG TPA: amidohydrolase family protein [Gammaproteobacteria bacterium]